jgi:uncharacterized protein YjcR
MVVKGRSLKGSRRPDAKVTEDQVREMRELRQKGMLLRELAEKYGLSKIGVHQIVRRHRWKHV